MKLVFKRSVMIEVYRSVHRMIENNFYLTQRTLRHSNPKMLATLRKLGKHIMNNNAHQFTKGRSAKHSIPNVISEGFAQLNEVTDLGTVSVEVDGTDSSSMAEATRGDVGAI